MSLKDDKRDFKNAIKMYNTYYENAQKSKFVINEETMFKYITIHTGILNDLLFLLRAGSYILWDFTKNVIQNYGSCSHHISSIDIFPNGDILLGIMDGRVEIINSPYTIGPYTFQIQKYKNICVMDNGHILTYDTDLIIYKKTEKKWNKHKVIECKCNILNVSTFIPNYLLIYSELKLQIYSINKEYVEREIKNVSCAPKKISDSTIAYGLQNGSVCILDIKKECKILKGHTTPINVIDVYNHHIISGSNCKNYDNKTCNIQDYLKIWDMHDMKYIGSVYDDEHIITSNGTLMFEDIVYCAGKLHIKTSQFATYIDYELDDGVIIKNECTTNKYVSQACSTYKDYCDDDIPVQHMFKIYHKHCGVRISNSVVYLNICDCRSYLLTTNSVINTLLRPIIELSKKHPSFVIPNNIAEHFMKKMKSDDECMYIGESNDICYMDEEDGETRLIHQETDVKLNMEDAVDFQKEKEQFQKEKEQFQKEKDDFKNNTKDIIDFLKEKEQLRKTKEMLKLCLLNIEGKQTRLNKLLEENEKFKEKIANVDLDVIFK